MGKRKDQIKRPPEEQYFSNIFNSVRHRIDCEWPDYKSFMDHVIAGIGPRPDKHFLSRIRKTKGYLIENLQWKPQSEMGYVYIEAFGDHLTFLDWLGDPRMICKSPDAITGRIKAGMTFEQAISKPCEPLPS